MTNPLADGIGPEGLLLLGGIYFLIPALAVIIVEAAALRLILPLTFRRAMKWSFKANLLSALAGIPFLWYFAARFDAYVPSDLHLYFAAYMRFAVMRYLVYFALSVVVEFGAGLWMNKKLPVKIGVVRLFTAFVLANGVSYGLLSAPYYFMTRPTHSFARMTGSTEWSPDSTSPIFFIDPATNHLCRTISTGKNVQTVFPFEMSEYQLSPDLQTCVFLWKESIYYVHNGVTHPTKLAAMERERPGFSMTLVALSPSGQKVAYTTPVSKTNEAGGTYIGAETLCIFDAGTGKTTEHLECFGDSSRPALAWTQSESVLIATSGGKSRAVLCTLNGASVSTGDLNSLNGVTLCPNHGMFPHSEAYQIIARDQSANGEYDAEVWNVIQPQKVRIATAPWPDLSEAHEVASLDDNPGIPILSYRRQYSDIAFLPCSSLAVLADETFSMLYLIDPKTKTIGTLHAGRAPVLLTDKYEMKSYFKTVYFGP